MNATELVLTVAAARHAIAKKIEPLVYLHIFTNISLQSATSENCQQERMALQEQNFSVQL